MSEEDWQYRNQVGCTIPNSIEITGLVLTIRSDQSRSLPFADVLLTIQIHIDRQTKCGFDSRCPLFSQVESLEMQVSVNHSWPSKSQHIQQKPTFSVSRPFYRCNSRMFQWRHSPTQAEKRLEEENFKL